MMILSENYPDIVIAGYMESGTTALYRYITEHPDVIPNRSKELNHLDMGWKYGLSYYRRKLNFRKKKYPHQKTIDASPNYVFHPLVPKRLRKLNPNVRVLICLRHPADRCLAQIWKYRGGDWQSAFRDEKIQWSYNPIRKMITVGHLKKGVPDYVLYQKFFMELSRYVNHVSRWLTVFPNKQVMLIDSRDLKNDTQETMNQVFRFVGVEPISITQKLHNVTREAELRKETHAVLRDELARYFGIFNKRLDEFLEKKNYPKKFEWDDGLKGKELENLGPLPSCHPT